MFVVGLLGLISKLHKWTESAVFFDGTSLGVCHFRVSGSILVSSKQVVYVFGIMVYLSVTISALRTIANPIAGETHDDQVMALRVLSAGNVIIIGCLTLILALQVSIHRDFR